MRFAKNLHNGSWSIRAPKVIGYEKTLLIKNPKFITSEKTQSRIMRIYNSTGKYDRNVHAYIEGDIVNNESMDTTGLERISYNPFFHHLFYKSETKELLTSCPYRMIYLHSDGYAYGIN